ncbi:MAG: ribonuclease P protein component [Candidatus Shapirobacteria bacterium]|nr:ribonuclease P protein component [Candidatus Shapirobacteria bacterium]
MLKRENRIRSKKEFAEIKDKGIVSYSPFFGWLKYKVDDDLKKFGFIVSKKISKKAVSRNKIRRILSEIVRKNLDKFEKGTRLVFLTKKEILGKKMDEVEKEINKFLISNDK